MKKQFRASCLNSDGSRCLVGKKSRKRKAVFGWFFDEKYLSNFPVALVRNESEIVAFANIWTGADNEEISVDLMRHSPNAPERAMEYLLSSSCSGERRTDISVFLLEWLLSGLENRQFAPIIKWSLVFAHGEHFIIIKD